MTSETPDLPGSWDAEDAEVRKRKVPWLFVGIGIVAAITVGLVAWRLIAQEDTTWPASLSWRPQGMGDAATGVPPSAEPGVYVWSDFDSFHLWVVHGEDIGQVTGSIQLDNDLTSATLEVPGSGTVTVDGDRAEFTLPANPAGSGIAFSPSFYVGQIEIEVATEEGPLAPADVRLGGNATPATSMPVVIKQVPKDEAPNR